MSNKLSLVISHAGYSAPRATVLPASEGLVEGRLFVGPTGAPYAAGILRPEGLSPEDSARPLFEDYSTIGQVLSTDGSRRGTMVLRRRFTDGRLEQIPALDPYSDKSVRLPSSKVLKPIDGRAEGVFFEAHSHIRDIDGLHADEALDEVCKILYAKLYDEEQAAAGSGSHPISRFEFGCTEELAATIRDLYTSASEYDSRVFGAKIPRYKQSRGVFGKPFRLSSPALVKVWSAVAPYDLTSSSSDVKGRAFQRVLGSAVRSGMGQYFTPEAVVHFAVNALAPSVSDLILDPFCGSGRFLSRALAHVRESIGIDARALHEFAFGKLHGIEKSERMVRIAMTDMRLQGDGHSNVRCTDALLGFENYHDLSPGAFDVILTNPPFGSLLGPEALAHLGAFDLARPTGSTPLEVIGVERCIQLLRPGGRLGIVVPDGLLGDRSKQRVRAWLRRSAKVRAVISLPVSTFSPFGAAVSTSLLILRKWRDGEERTVEYPVFVAKVEDPGHDTTGRPTQNKELPIMAEGFRQFIAEHGW